MKACLFFISMFLLVFICSFKTNAQTVDADSLEQTILKSVQSQLNKSYLPKSFFDSLKSISSYSPVDLKNLFEDVHKQISEAKSAGDIGSIGKAYRKLSTMDSMKGNYKDAYENYKLYTIYRDSLQKKEYEKKELQAKMQREFDKKQAKQKLEKEKEERKNTIRQIFLFAFLIAFVTIAASFFIAYKREQKGKKLLNTQKEEIENTLQELKSTQAQLIHSEKMASLGELTAGIAHEIQNPLNFVNNFSEVNNELIEELKDETLKLKAADQQNLLNDIFQNNEKIAFHSKRADAIVKGMLQHSRQTTGLKEPANLNALCDEYLRLSFHGLRAKDKSFNADFKMDLDENIGKINIVSQDIGRVLLNLFNNAFYAVNEKRKAEGESYKPQVLIQTKKLNNEVEIVVSDNGNGIPQNVIDKIFQPFFTTKPTGQGTGLGLSLAYDIITKEHNGSIKAESKVNEGSKFIIQLPLA